MDTKKGKSAEAQGGVGVPKGPSTEGWTRGREHGIIPEMESYLVDH